MTGNNLYLERVTYDNLEIVWKIQNKLFPKEAARENYVDSINKKTLKKRTDLLYSLLWYRACWYNWLVLLLRVS